MISGKEVISFLAKAIPVGLTVYLIFSEVRYLLTIPSDDFSSMLARDPDLFMITMLRAVMIFLALPVFYTFKLLSLFDFPLVKNSDLFQTDLFYEAIYITIVLSMVARAIVKLL